MVMVELSCAKTFWDANPIELASIPSIACLLLVILSPIG
jgi:hypothetical protein